MVTVNSFMNIRCTDAGNM